LALKTIPFFSTILKNYLENIEKSFQKGQEFDTKFRHKDREIVLWKNEMS